jgi:hypothetical protein
VLNHLHVEVRDGQYKDDLGMVHEDSVPHLLARITGLTRLPFLVQVIEAIEVSCVKT